MAPAETYIGIDLGGTYIKGVATDRTGSTFGFRRIETKKTAIEIDESIDAVIRDLAASAGLTPDKVSAIGIGSAGPVDRRHGTILDAPNIPALKGHPLAASLGNRTGVRVFLENDATAALVGAKWLDCDTRYRDWIMITLGTGIGGGLVIGGSIYTGRNGNAMEIGHMTIDFNGRVCGCGGRGCWERYASGSGMVNTALAALQRSPDSSIASRLKTESLTPRVICEEAADGDPTARSILDEYATYLGIGLANLVNIAAPEAIYIGGGISRSWEMFRPAVLRVIEERALPGLNSGIAIAPVRDPDRLPAFGAAKIAIESGVF